MMRRGGRNAGDEEAAVGKWADALVIRRESCFLQAERQ